MPINLDPYQRTSFSLALNMEGILYLKAVLNVCYLIYDLKFALYQTNKIPKDHTLKAELNLTILVL